MALIGMYVPGNKVGLKCPYSMNPKFVVVHNTANDASARAEVSYMIGNNNSTSYHYAVDGVDIVQGISEDRNAWHCGATNGNRNAISIEICYSKSGGQRFEAAERQAADLVADICKRYGWGIDKVQTHQQQNGKYCPHRTIDNGWQRFLNMVQSFLNGTAPAAPSKPEAPTPQQPQPPKAKSIPDVKYQAYAAGKWWGEIVNYGNDSDGYAGIYGTPITGIRSNTVGTAAAAGHLRSCAHLKGGEWLAWVTDRSDYIGIYGKPIDCIQMELINLPGRAVEYRVHLLGGVWLEWVRQYGANDDPNGYAGIYGKEIDGLQVRIV